VQVVADPAGRLIWTSPALPGARHDMGAAREHGILDALNAAGLRVVARRRGRTPVAITSASYSLGSAGEEEDLDGVDEVGGSARQERILRPRGQGTPRAGHAER
jgi:hypothetical protein